MKEEDIRPEKIFSEHLRLCKEDAQTYFQEVQRERIKCPACDSIGELAFEKQGFEYELKRLIGHFPWIADRQYQP